MYNTSEARHRVREDASLSFSSHSFLPTPVTSSPFKSKYAQYPVLKYPLIYVLTSWEEHVMTSFLVVSYQN